MAGGYPPNASFSKKLFAVCLLLSLTPYLLLTAFTRPAYDDYTWAAHFLTRGFLGTQTKLYNTFIGRYFSSALVTVGPLSYDSLITYKAMTFAIVVLTGVSIFAFVSSALKRNVTWIDKLIATAFLWALFSNQTPDITEAYFWLTSDLVYQLAGILTLFFFALVLRSPSKSRVAALTQTLAGGLLIAAIIGCNETSMAVLDLLVLVITIVAWSKKSEQRWRWTAFLIVAVCCSLIVILAPGNARRSLAYPGGRRFFFSVGMSTLQVVRFLATWLTNVAFVLVTLFFIPVASTLTRRFEALRRHRLHPVISTGVLLAIVFLGFFPAYWGMGTMGQHRTVNTVYFLFIIGWFVNLTFWISYLQDKCKWYPLPLPKFVYFIGLPLIVGTLWFTNNTREAISDLVSLRAYRYDQLARERDRWLESCWRESGACIKQPIGDLPTSLTNPYFEETSVLEPQYWKARVRQNQR